MIRFQRSRKVSHHKLILAIKYAMEAAEFINRRYPEVHFQVFTGLFDAVETVYWISDFEGLAALEHWLQKLDLDKEWQEFVSTKSQGLFIEGTTNETVIKQA